MTVPKYIENKMRRALRHYQTANYLMDDVNLWFESKGYDMLALRDGDGQSLEEIEYGTENAVDEFLEKLAEMDGGKEDV